MAAVPMPVAAAPPPAPKLREPETQAPAYMNALAAHVKADLRRRAPGLSAEKISHDTEQLLSIEENRALYAASVSALSFKYSASTRMKLTIDGIKSTAQFKIGAQLNRLLVVEGPSHHFVRDQCVPIISGQYLYDSTDEQQNIAFGCIYVQDNSVVADFFNASGEVIGNFTSEAGSPYSTGVSCGPAKWGEEDW